MIKPSAIPLAAGLLAVTFLIASCDDRSKVIRLSGNTMGTTYNVTVVDAPDGESPEDLYEAVEAVLADVNARMSNWDPSSEISRFNSSASTEPVRISDDLAGVMELSNAIHDLSGGRFDVTLAPLISLWGFGETGATKLVPRDGDIERAMKDVGQRKLVELLDGPMLVKRRPGVSINLSAIAKGYGIDSVAAALEERGIERYLVEIGGDLVAAGANPDRKRWRIGIERPVAGQSEVEEVIAVTDIGMATSGDYRNYFETDGERYSHIIDSLTGRPITHETASVTVLSELATLADGLATALLVMGTKMGMKMAEENGIAALFIDHAGNGFVTRESTRFVDLTATE